MFQTWYPSPRTLCLFCSTQSGSPQLRDGENCQPLCHVPQQPQQHVTSQAQAGLSPAPGMELGEIYDEPTPGARSRGQRAARLDVNKE